MKGQYILKEKKDFIILNKIKELNSLSISRKDKEVVKLIKNQLKKDWRKPLIIYLNKLIKKYQK
jgi:hypothetical protein